MKVRATKRHGNDHGKNYWKNSGTEYVVEDAEGERLIRRGLVESAGKATKEA